MVEHRHEYQKMFESEAKLWWYQCLHKLTLQAIQTISDSTNLEILDAGCGTGGILNYLRNNGYKNLKGFDLSEDAIEFSKSINLDVQCLDLRDIDKIGTSESLDVIILSDVIYYIEESELQEVLLKCKDMLRTGGAIIINAMAFEHFSGIHDLSVGVDSPSKRKRKNYIVDLSKMLGFKLRVLRYWPFLLSPLIFITRLGQRLKLRLNKNVEIKSDISIPNSYINNLFLHLTNFEIKHITFSFWGSSVFALLEK